MPKVGVSGKNLYRDSIVKNGPNHILVVLRKIDLKINLKVKSFLGQQPK